MLEPDENGIILELKPTPVRRTASVAALYLLGLLFISLVWQSPPTFGWAVLLIGLGLLAIWAGERLRHATRISLQLTTEGLQDDGGRMIARWEDIARVERGTFAMKPSNGFLLVLHNPGPRGWVPGIWWQVGRRIGVGGALPMRETKFMAEQIAFQLALAGR